MREIGSEFWVEESFFKDSYNFQSTPDEAWLLSGRTALDFIIRDILQTRMMKTIAIPSYCCESMVDPFVKNNVRIQFYDVNINGPEYIVPSDTDGVLILDYFGYTWNKNIEIARDFHSAGKIVIYDSTHKLQGNSDIEAFADYSFISYRKWFYCNCAKARKCNGEFVIRRPVTTNESYCRLRDEAAEKKADFICERTKTIEKRDYLFLYKQAEDLLESDYANWGAQGSFPENLDHMIHKRRENAKYLVDRLLDISGITLWGKLIKEDDTPLFVPIFVSPHVRDQLKECLIEENIYCPVHWPMRNDFCITGEEKEIYNMELSLICDQRYGKEDMDKEVSTIRKFMETV